MRKKLLLPRLPWRKFWRGSRKENVDATSLIEEHSWRKNLMLLFLMWNEFLGGKICLLLPFEWRIFLGEREEICCCCHGEKLRKKVPVDVAAVEKKSAACLVQVLDILKTILMLTQIPRKEIRSWNLWRLKLRYSLNNFSNSNWSAET